MNDTKQSPPGADQGAEFDPHRLRTITDMRRSEDDRIIAGVCAGAARYLNIDPVIVRVVIAVLTVAGFAGVIVYAAAWFFLPSERADKSIAADWFKLDKNEEQVRVAGLVGAVILAIVSIVGNNSWAWWGGPMWLLVPAAALYYLFAVRPRRRQGETTQAQFIAAQKTATPRRPRSPALLGLTASLAAIALAATWIYEETQKDLPWTTYLAVALAVVALGLLVSTMYGDGGILIVIGIFLALALAIGSVFPSGRIGADRPTPSTASEVKGTYRHGIGLLELDLTRVADANALLGRTVRIDAGVGQTTVIVPAGLNVTVTSDLDAGQLVVFDRQAEGTDNRLAYPAELAGPTFTLDIDQRIGNIEVIRR